KHDPGAQPAGSPPVTTDPGGSHPVTTDSGIPVAPAYTAEDAAGGPDGPPPGGGPPGTTDRGIPVAPVYTAEDVAGGPDALAARLGRPGEPPFTRGPYESMYRGQLWTMRQFAGYGSPEETNARFHFLLGRGQTAL